MIYASIDHVNSDDFRNLCARREGPQLDFKESFYENSDVGNAEFAKDIMAIANALTMGTTGHILVGVRETSDKTGEVIGCTLANWVTDANLHQKARSFLNRLPPFSLHTLEVDGFTVAAITIEAGQRPFFPLRDKGPLRRNIAVVRLGSSTDVASPDEIIGWAKQDENIGARKLEAEHLEAQQVLKPRLLQGGGVKNGSKYEIRFKLLNDGIAPFEPTRAWLTWSPRPDALRHLLTSNQIRLLQFPADFVQDLHVVTQTVHSKDLCELTVLLDVSETIDDLLSHLQPYLEGVPCSPELLSVQLLDCFESRVLVSCRNLLATRTETASAQLNLFT